MPRLDESRPTLLDALRDRYGTLSLAGGGPGADADPFDVIATVALQLATDARTAASARAVLEGSGLLDPSALAEADPLELEALFQSHKVRLAPKAFTPLLRLARWAVEADFGLEAAASASTETLRDAWRAIKGVGPATADALLLFALGRPAYPVDRGSYRIFARHGWIDTTADYDEARSALESVAPDDPASLAQLSLGLERLARDLCKPGTPRCDRCPLQPLLPEGGPLGGD